MGERLRVGLGNLRRRLDSLRVFFVLLLGSPIHITKILFAYLCCVIKHQADDILFSEVWLGIKRASFFPLERYYKQGRFTETWREFLSKVFYYRYLNHKVCKLIDDACSTPEKDPPFKTRLFGAAEWEGVDRSKTPVIFYSVHHGCDRLPQLLSTTLNDTYFVAHAFQREGLDKKKNILYLYVNDPQKRLMTLAVYQKALHSGAYGVSSFDMSYQNIKTVPVKYLAWTVDAPIGLLSLLKSQPIAFVPTLALLGTDITKPIDIYFHKPIICEYQESDKEYTHVLQILFDALAELLEETKLKVPEAAYQIHFHRINSQ